MISSFQDLLDLVKGQPPKRVALVAAENAVLIEAAAKAQSEGLAEFFLIGSAEKIKSLVAPFSQDFEIVDSADPARDAITLIRDQKANLLMKGKITTGTLLKAV